LSNSGYGALVEAGSALSLQGGAITDNGVGVGVVGPECDFSPLYDDVLFRGNNMLNLQCTHPPP
jgi:hypothetical protein